MILKNLLQFPTGTAFAIPQGPSELPDLSNFHARALIDVEPRARVPTFTRARVHPRPDPVKERTYRMATVSAVHPHRKVRRRRLRRVWKPTTTSCGRHRRGENPPTALSISRTRASSSTTSSTIVKPSASTLRQPRMDSWKGSPPRTPPREVAPGIREARTRFRCSKRSPRPRARRHAPRPSQAHSSRTRGPASCAMSRRPPGARRRLPREDHGLRLRGNAHTMYLWA